MALLGRILLFILLLLLIITIGASLYAKDDPSLFSLEYDKDGEELLKVWPGNLNINMPKMIFKRENINHLMVIKSIQEIKKNRYKMRAITTVNDIVTISGEALIVVL